MTDWQFRILGTTADFAADLNAMAAANGYPNVMPAGWSGSETVVLDDVTRIDFDTFTLPSGLHVNARMTFLPQATATQQATFTALWTQAIADWFGAGGGKAQCSALANFTNPQLPAVVPPKVQQQVGGQSWKSAGKTIFISPPPSVPKRVWA